MRLEARRIRDCSELMRGRGGSLHSGRRPERHGVASAGVTFVLMSSGFPHGMAAAERVHLLARGLVDAGDRAHVLCLRAFGRPGDALSSETSGVSDYGIPFAYTTRSPVRPGSFVGRRFDDFRGLILGLVRLACLGNRRNREVAYLYGFTSNWTLAGSLVRLTCWVAGVPCVLELCERPWSMKPAPGLIERRVPPLWAAAGVVAISDFLRNWALTTVGQCSGHAVLKVPVLVDCEEWRSRRSNSTGTYVLLSAAIGYEETIRFCVDAMQELWSQRLDCRLCLTGVDESDPAAQWLVQLIAERGLGSRVHLLGYLSRTAYRDWVEGSAALLAPLFDDVRSCARFPTKIGEYLASGRPVVASRVGEVAELLEHEVSAYLVEPGDIGGYAAAIREVLEEPQAAATVGAAGRRVAETSLDYRVHGACLHAFLSCLLQSAC